MGSISEEYVLYYKCYQASIEGLNESVGAYQRNKIWISNSITHHFWFSRFMEGVHKRVGQIKMQDEAITIGVIKDIERMLELEWNGRGNSHWIAKLRLAELGYIFIVGFCTGLRGEELMLVELAGTRNSFQHLLDDPGYFTLVLTGRTKGNKISGSKVGFPCAGITRGNNLNPGRWVQRLVNIRCGENDGSGRLLYRRLIPGRVSEWEYDFYLMLEEVQNSTAAIKSSENVREAYRILRSGRRGATAHARNMKIPRYGIEAVRRWRIEALVGGVGIRLDLIDVFTSLDALAPTLVRYLLSF